MSKEYKVVQNYNLCMGCSACMFAAPKFWAMGDDGKVKLEGAKIENEKFVLIGDEDLLVNLDAAKSCPVNCISVYDIDDKEEKKIS